MYKLLWKDKIVAIQDGSNLKCLNKELVPFALFINKDSVSIFDFINWMSTRVFQDSRLDLNDLLKSLNLKEYDVLKIVDKTKAILTGVDFYSVEWIDD